MIRVAVGVIAALAGIAVAFGLLLLRDERAAPPIIIEVPGPEATIVVAIDGAVATPGVYPLPGGARLQDALIAAGGMTDDADQSDINLAMRLYDGERLTIPARSSDVAASMAATLVSGAAAAAVTGPINVNTATIEQLVQLPRIGPALAQRIIDYRAANGPFTTVEELDNVSGISAGIVEELRPLVTVG